MRINRYIPVFQGPLDTPYHRAWFEEAKARLAKVNSSGPLPDKYVQSNFEALNALKIGMEMSKFDGAADTMKLIGALEGLKLKAGPEFPQGDKTIRKEDHQAFPQEFIFEVVWRNLHLKETVPGDKTIFTARLHVRAHKCAPKLRSTSGSPVGGRGVSASPLLKTELLSVKFGGLAALSEVNFQVARDEVRAVIGPNGAGKSTFFNCLTGVLRPTGGRIIFDGEEITGLRPISFRGKVSRVPIRSPIFFLTPVSWKTFALPPSHAGTPGIWCRTTALLPMSTRAPNPRCNRSACLPRPTNWPPIYRTASSAILKSVSRSPPNLNSLLG